MSMMTLLRRAFGFTPDSEDEEEDYDPTVPTYAAAGHDATARTETTGSTGSTVDTATAAPGTATVSAALPEALFDAVIEIFNNAQPDFVKKCLDTEAQRRYLIESIDQGLRQKVEQSMRTSAEHWKEEKAQLESRIAQLEGDDNAVAALRKENKRLQLSVDRQKRALLDRINDLEAQLAKSAEEKERYYSRRKPTATDEELAQAKARIEELEAAAKAAEESAAAAPGKSSEEQEQEMAALKAAHEQAIEALKAAHEQELAAVKAECSKQGEEAARQLTLREQLEVKTAMSDAMINDLRNQAASARRELEKIQEEQEKAVEAIKQQLDGFEDLKARKDARIAELQESNASLRRTIETNLYNQANSEMRLRREIKELQAQLAKADAARPSAATGADGGAAGIAEPSGTVGTAEPQNHPEPEPSATQPRRRGRPRKVRIDSSLDNTDWFAGKRDDPDFGYHEPPRKPVNDNEAQLSLF